MAYYEFDRLPKRKYKGFVLKHTEDYRHRNGIDKRGWTVENAPIRPLSGYYFRSLSQAKNAVNEYVADGGIPSGKRRKVAMGRQPDTRRTLAKVEEDRMELFDSLRLSWRSAEKLAKDVGRTDLQRVKSDLQDLVQDGDCDYAPGHYRFPASRLDEVEIEEDADR